MYAYHEGTLCARFFPDPNPGMRENATGAWTCSRQPGLSKRTGFSGMGAAGFEIKRDINDVFPSLSCVRLIQGWRSA